MCGPFFTIAAVEHEIHRKRCGMCNLDRAKKRQEQEEYVGSPINEPKTFEGPVSHDVFRFVRVSSEYQ